VPIRVTAGPIESEITLQVIVGQSKLYLPAISR